VADPPAGAFLATQTPVLRVRYADETAIDASSFRAALNGSDVTALFTVGRFLIGLYIGKSGIASGFGAAGSVAVIFVWVYYSAQIFLLGAEFTWVYARTFGSMRDLAESPKTPAGVPRSDVTPGTRSALPAAPMIDVDAAP